MSLPASPNRPPMPNRRLVSPPRQQGQQLQTRAIARALPAPSLPLLDRLAPWLSRLIAALR